MHVNATAKAKSLSAHDVSHLVVKSALKVHSALGPGLLESAYETCLSHELRKSGLRIQTQVPLPVVYDGVTLDIGYRIDLIIEALVFVEIKAIEEIAPIHQAQLLSYLKLSGKSLGLIINFHVPHLKEGVKRLVNGSGWK